MAGESCPKREAILAERGWPLARRVNPTTLTGIVVDAHSTPLAVPTLIRQRSWWLLLLLVWVSLMGLALFLHLSHLRQQAIELALVGARNMLHTVVLTRQWNANHGGVYVPVTAQTQPNIYLDDPQRDVVTRDGQQLTKVNPAYMTRMIAELSQAERGAVFRITSLKPLNPANAPDPWERASLETFEQGISETHTIEASAQGELLRYMAPLKVTQACLQCHQKQHYQVGDVRGGISVSQPYERVLQAARQTNREARWSYAGVTLLVAAMGWVLLELLRRRWMAQVTQAVQLSQTQQRLMQAEKVASVGKLAAGMAHQINNPLAFVTANLNTLSDYSGQLFQLAHAGRAGKATAQDYAQVDLDYLQQDLPDLVHESQTGLARIKALVAQLREFSHIDHQAWRRVDLNACIESTLQITQAEWGERIELVRELSPLPSVRCLSAQINQVVQALLRNAAQAIDQTGRITVRSGSLGTEVWVEVSDTGVGMTEQVKRQMFEPFFTTRPKSNGLGLSTAQDIISAHGGRFEVTSTPGAGTTVRFYLPVSQQDDPPLQPQAKPDAR